MADHLPDDPRHWPRDPFQLLGVEPSASEMDVKRAYTQLIRRFKPEHSPEQFRLVREAYEAALEHRKWYPVFPTDVSPPADDPTPVIVTSGDAPPESAAPPDAPELARPRPARGPEDEAWALAVAGETAEAYTRLVELARSRVESAELALRLYWLLAVHPALDADRTRHDWLAAALVRSRLRGPGVELYRRELEADPVAALSGRYVRLLETEANHGDVLAVARQRVMAAMVIRRWHVIDADLAALAARVGEFDEGAWLAYLTAAMTCLAFELPAPATERCRNLLAGLRHLELSHGWAFDMIDEHELLARAWQDAYQVPVAVREVVRLAWSGPYGAWRKGLGAAAEWVRDDPAAALRQLDLAGSIQECQPVLLTYSRLLEELRSEEGRQYPPGLIRGFAREVLERTPDHGYAALRGELLRVLIAEAIDPEELWRACFPATHTTSRWLSSEVRADPAIHLAWRTATAQA